MVQPDSVSWQLFAATINALQAAVDRADDDECSRLVAQLQTLQESLPDLSSLAVEEQQVLLPLLQHAQIVISVVSQQLRQRRDDMGEEMQRVRTEKKLHSAYGEE